MCPTTDIMKCVQAFDKSIFITYACNDTNTQHITYTYYALYFAHINAVVSVLNLVYTQLDQHIYNSTVSCVEILLWSWHIHQYLYTYIVCNLFYNLCINFDS